MTPITQKLQLYDPFMMLENKYKSKIIHLKDVTVFSEKT